MSKRIDSRFATLRAANRAGLVCYVMGFDPDRETSFEILRNLPAAGADIIELGFAFSDPMADGVSIQRGAERALHAGASLRGTLDLVRRFRLEDSETPVILMGYDNPVEQMTYPVFAQAMADAGADGAIIVDLPPEEDQGLRAEFGQRGLSLIRLATPTTDDKRLPTVLEGVSGFLYYVSVTGVTGTKKVGAEAAQAAVARLKRSTDLPIAVGFGVRDPEAARAIARTADAVVVGSMFVDDVRACVEAGKPHESVAAVVASVKKMSQAVRSARMNVEA
ncbi:MAG TPA: tryptophan synthase subunit alpha [Caulobacterales bacterium]|nr:tryptophan synthase subunit alpha [Caulobacterales bacterium]